MKGISKYIRDFFTKKGRMGQLSDKGLEKYPLHPYYTGGGGATGLPGALAVGGGFAVGKVAFNKDDDEATIREKWKQLGNKKNQSGEYTHPDIAQLYKQDVDNKIKTSEIIKQSQKESARLESQKGPGFTESEIEQEQIKDTGTTGHRGTEKDLSTTRKARINRKFAKFAKTKNLQDFKESIDDKFRVLYADDGSVIDIYDPQEEDENGDPARAPKSITKRYKAAMRQLAKRNKDGDVGSTGPTDSLGAWGSFTHSEKAQVTRLVDAAIGKKASAKDRELAARKFGPSVRQMIANGNSPEDIDRAIGAMVEREELDRNRRETAKKSADTKRRQKRTRGKREDLNAGLVQTGKDADGNPTRTNVSDQEAEADAKAKAVNENSIAVKQAERQREAGIQGVVQGGGGSPTVKQLKEELKAQGLPVSGKKKELIERLRKAQGGQGGQGTDDKDSTGGKPIKMGLPHLEEIFEFDKKEKKRKVIGTATGATIGGLAAASRHRDWRLYDALEKLEGRQLAPKHKLKANLRLHGGSLARLGGGALIGYGIAHAINKKKRKDAIRSIQRSKS